MSTLGSRLRSAREKKGWTQTFVCQKLGISNSVLSGYERDYREPDADMISRLSELYEVTTDYLLLGRTDNPSSGKESDLPEELNDPEFNIFFKDFLSAPEERRREMIEIWEIIKKREAGRKPEDKQGE